MSKGGSVERGSVWACGCHCPYALLLCGVCVVIRYVALRDSVAEGQVSGMKVRCIHRIVHETITPGWKESPPPDGRSERWR